MLRARRSDDPLDKKLRPLALRMGLLTVGLTGALVLVLALVLYLTVRGALRTNLEVPLTTRAKQQTRELAALVRHPERGREHEDVTAGVFVTYVNSHAAVVGGSLTPFGDTIPDVQAVSQALRVGRPVFSSRSSKAGQPYLLYSLPVIRHGHVVGVVQAGIAAQQYVRNLEALLRILVLAGGLGLLVSALISAAVVGRAMRPIQLALGRQRDFVADAAHELRTPVTVIRSTAELTLNAIGSEEHREPLERILVQSRHLTRMIGDLSLLARADSGTLLLERRQVELDALVRQTVSDLEPLATDRGVRLTVQPCAQMRIVGDADRLRQILIILLDNALKYTPAGGAITVSLEHDRHRVRLEVRDTGTGILPRDLPHLFDRFYRADHSARTESAGLGLAIGRSIAEAHGGNLTAASAPGDGATFVVTLPIGRARDDKHRPS